ncbi:DUF397 domain-containing protein [Actinomadura parmotrematis]|uniref:DUF397 domain-containing protein n=1 Tax=Actinomadura parmotrematis TaxID=2864039 RepID=A0ABS7FU62_9ACTN|nr:DUF397 domain-containing protein [Actinomadura parmotrematis]MBW8483944.1 DUF397 domain-containing protein [Actinomadura parmotrematis]
MGERRDPAWRRSLRSTSGENCVEVAALPAAVAVRDSKDPDGSRLAFGRACWADFAARLKAGRHDLP